MLDGGVGPWGTLAYDYDSVGNRTSYSLDPGTGAVVDAYTYGATNNRLSVVNRTGQPARSFTFDAAGNTLQEVRTVGIGSDTWAYAYNVHGRLVSVTLNGSLQAEYVYNFQGQQVLRTVWNGGVATKTVSVFDQWGHRIAEYDGDTNTLLREYIWLGDRPVAVIEGTDIFYIHVDYINRPMLATDDTGAVVWSATYYPFGGIHQVNVDTGALSAQELRFPGQWFQAETGFHQNWHRTYDPTLGRYLEADPLGLVDGPSVYGYAMQSPLRYVDPTGLEFVAPPTSLSGGGDIVGGFFRTLRFLRNGAGAAAVASTPIGACAIAFIFIDLATAGPACGCDECDEQKEIDETQCYAFTNRRAGGRSAKANLALCLKTAQERYSQCRTGISHRTPLFGVETPL